MPSKIVPLMTDIAFAAWILLVAVSYFGPYMGFSVPAELTARGYAVLLVIALVTLALRLVRRNGSTPNASALTGKGGAS